MLSPRTSCSTISADPVPSPPASSSPAQGPSLFRRFILPGLFVAALFVALYMRRADPDLAPQTIVISGQTMGTTYAIKIVIEGPTDTIKPKLEAAITTTLEQVNDEMSTYRPRSALSTFNDHQSTEPMVVPTSLSDIVQLAQRIHRQSHGAFDITVGPLVDAWGFGPDGKSTPPDAAQLAELRRFVGSDKISVKAGALTKRDPRARVDLSAIAKGHGVDRVAQAIDAVGPTRYLVEIGGEVRVKGTNEAGVPGRIGIEPPTAGVRSVRDVVQLQNQSMATSGDYRNYYEKNGQRISHTIDPRTGHPITHRLASVSVIDDDCAKADGWATALNVLGPQEGPKVARAESIDALFIIREPDGRFTEILVGDFAQARLGTRGSR